MGNAGTGEVRAYPCADMAEDTIVGRSAVEDKGVDNPGSTEVDVTADERSSCHAVAVE